MKKILSTSLFICYAFFATQEIKGQNIGIGTTTPHPSAVLEVSSSNKGFLPPRMSTSQLTAIPNPKKGLMVYDTTQNEHVYFDGGKWRPFYAQNYDSAVVDYSSSASAAINMPLTGSVTASGNAGFIYDNGGPAGNYFPNSNSSVIIPFDDSTLQIKILIEEMNAEVFYDSLYLLLYNNSSLIYDTAVRLGGTQGGVFLFANDVKITFKSNSIINLAGFTVRWGKARVGNSFSSTTPLFGWNIDNKKYAAMGGVQKNNNWHTDSVGFGSFSYGVGSKAKGKYSIAQGYYNNAIGENSFASGYNTDAVGTNSYSSGKYSTANGDNSIAMGNRTIAQGNSSTALGFLSIAGGTASTAMGDNTVALGYASTVIGMYNKKLLPASQNSSATPNTPLFIIGNGSGYGTENNAMVVYKSGDVDINGNLKIDNGTSVWSSIPTGFAANRTTTLSVIPSSFTDVLFTTQSADDGGDNYNPVTGEFTAPTAGMYRFEASVYWASGIAGFENIYFYVNGTTRRFHSIVSANNAAHTLPYSASFKLAVGDVVKVVTYHTNATPVNIAANSNGTYFTGVKLY